MVFVDLKHILSKEILKNSNFTSLNSVIALHRKAKVYGIIWYFYKSNIKIEQKIIVSLIQS